MDVNGVALFTAKEYPEDKLTTKEKNRIRKPVVEKMRRDRINLSINQLRKLLEQEFQLLQPDSKPEKADILEIAVQFLKQQICRYPNDNKTETRNNTLEYSHGYSKCLHETLSFLSMHRIQEHTQVKLLNHFHQFESYPEGWSQPRRNLKNSSYQMNEALLSTSSKTFWRPW
ncbi:transcription factor HES-5-like [Pelobates fuscus]|uniref:transcription factor HES-5-like n=1 Tax=Pelobates fuscus TaxID=191477 RepID=UPI002FE4C749